MDALLTASVLPTSRCGRRPSFQGLGWVGHAGELPLAAPNPIVPPWWLPLVTSTVERRGDLPGRNPSPNFGDRILGNAVSSIVHYHQHHDSDTDVASCFLPYQPHSLQVNRYNMIQIPSLSSFKSNMPLELTFSSSHEPVTSSSRQATSTGHDSTEMSPFYHIHRHFLGTIK